MEKPSLTDLALLGTSFGAGAAGAYFSHALFMLDTPREERVMPALLGGAFNTAFAGGTFYLFGNYDLGTGLALGILAMEGRLASTYLGYKAGIPSETLEPGGFGGLRSMRRPSSRLLNQ
jgi:hypothetical protein